MTAPGKITKTLAGIALSALALTSCSSEEDTADSDDGALDHLLAADARADQRAAGGATMMAMELGFDQVQPATDSDITAVQDGAADRAAAAQELNVEPSECAAPIAELDWSPILAPSDAITRVDFGTANFQGVGSIEVAGISEATGGSPAAADEVAEHQQAVEQITTQCNNLTMMLADESEPDWAELEYTFEAEAIETDSGSGLRWQRYPTDDPDTNSTTALTLMQQHEGHAIMVAFIGSPEISDDEFIDIADAILASAVAQLD